MIKAEGANVSGRSTRSWFVVLWSWPRFQLCFVLLILAGLLFGVASSAFWTNPGFEAKNLLSVGYSLELSGYDAEASKSFSATTMARLCRPAGVCSQSASRSRV